MGLCYLRVCKLTSGIPSSALRSEGASVFSSREYIGYVPPEWSLDINNQTSTKYVRISYNHIMLGSNYGKTMKMSRSPPVKASPLTSRVLKQIKSQEKRQYRTELKKKHSEKSNSLREYKAQALKSLRASRGTPEFNERYAVLAHADHNLREAIKHEFGNNTTYPNHPSTGDPYILLSDLQNPKYADVLLRLIAARFANSRISRRVSGQDKYSPNTRVQNLVGKHTELVRSATSYNRGGRKTKKSRR